MDEHGISKRILGRNIIGKKPVGKTKKRFVNEMEKDNREILKMRNWKRE
jgi:hypothetical protein